MLVFKKAGRPKALPTQCKASLTQCKLDASRWNIGCIGSPHIGACIGHVHFMSFVSISFVLGSQPKHNFWWNMGLRILKRGKSFVKAFGCTIMVQHCLEYHISVNHRINTFVKSSWASFLMKERKCPSPRESATDY